jgi:iron complex transport system ATP-binding protein
MKLCVEHVSWGVNGHPIVHDVDLHVEAGEFVGLIGPNGSGKSSLLRCIYRVLEPQAGLITLADDDVWQLNARQAAQRMAVVLQESPTEFDFTVEEIVVMGRSPYKHLFDRETEQDDAIVAQALVQVGMSAFAGRSYHTLSGGEKQRVLLARALAQQAQLLVLDEPTNHLDIRYQLEILELVKALGVTTFAAFHDLNLAALYCHRLYLLQGGEIVAAGAPEDVLQPNLIRAVYGVTAEVQVHPATGKLHLTFIPERQEGKNST